MWASCRSRFASVCLSCERSYQIDTKKIRRDGFDSLRFDHMLVTFMFDSFGRVHSMAKAGHKGHGASRSGARAQGSQPGQGRLDSEPGWIRSITTITGQCAVTITSGKLAGRVPLQPGALRADAKQLSLFPRAGRQRAGPCTSTRLSACRADGGAPQAMGASRSSAPPWPNGRGESARWTGGCIGAGNATAVRSARTKAVDYLAKVVTYLAKDVNGSAVDKEAAAHPEVQAYWNALYAAAGRLAVPLQVVVDPPFRRQGRRHPEQPSPLPQGRQRGAGIVPHQEERPAPPRKAPVVVLLRAGGPETGLGHAQDP